MIIEKEPIKYGGGFREPVKLSEPVLLEAPEGWELTEAEVDDLYRRLENLSPASSTPKPSSAPEPNPPKVNGNS